MANYREGEEAKDPETRKKAFNAALILYLQQESNDSSATLLFDIANTYFQLSEYGYAILYYYKALKEDPRNSVIQTNLLIALSRAGLAPQPHSILLFWHYDLSHNEKAALVLISLLCAFALLSVHIWLPQEVLKTLTYIACAIAAIFFCSLLWADYLATPDAVMVRSAPIRRDAGMQYAPVGPTPALAGTKVDILSTSPNSDWMHVRLPNGEEGYITKEYARVI